jgi:hypothetical protein
MASTRVLTQVKTQVYTQVSPLDYLTPTRLIYPNNSNQLGISNDEVCMYLQMSVVAYQQMK